MSQPLSAVEPSTLEDNKMTIHHFLHQSYDQAKKQLETGVAAISDSVSFIKDELITLYDRTGNYLQQMLLPVNNFLKDMTQIDSDFREADARSNGEIPATGCTIIPIEIASLSSGEENY